MEFSVLPKFWVETLSTAVHLINQLRAQHLYFDSPYFHVHGTHPSYDMLHTFGCVCFVHLPPYKRYRLAAQSYYVPSWVTAFLRRILFVMMGCYHFRISRNVISFENRYYFQHLSSSYLAPLISFEDCSR